MTITMIYFKYIALVLRCKAQYGLSLFLQTLAQFFASFSMLAVIYLLFDRFGSLAGWTLGEVALCFAVTNLAVALSELFLRGFDLFSSFVTSGDFDRLLLRPRALALQVLGSEISIVRLGKLAQSIMTLALAISWMDVSWTAGKVITLIFMVFGGVGIFGGILILGAAFCFVTIQGLEVVNVFFDGGRELASYPLSIYNKWVTRFFTFLIPFACVNYLPLRYIVSDGAPWGYILLPLVGVAFVLPCLAIWRLGVRKYLSTGS